MKELKKEIIKENTRREMLNSLVPQAIELIKDFRGKKITKTDGSVVKKLNDKVKEINAGLPKETNFYIIGSYSSLTFRGRTSYKDIDGHWIYVEPMVQIGSYEENVLQDIIEFTPLEMMSYEDEVAKVTSIQDKIKALEPELEDLNYLTRKILKDKNWRFFR